GVRSTRVPTVQPAANRLPDSISAGLFGADVVPIPIDQLRRGKWTLQIFVLKSTLQAGACFSGTAEGGKVYSE
ncbi:MAG TPA: hypothetical protein VI488_18585, partial [Candidatus Angelobacter sp.]